MTGEQYFLTSLIKALNINNINYCVLRNYAQLPVTTGNSDLDILVAKKDVKQFYKLLDDTLLKSNGAIIIKYGNLTPRVCVLGTYNNSNFGIQLDVHEGILPYKVCDIFPVNYMLERAVSFNGVKVANDNDASLLAFFKEMFYNKSCKENYFNKAKIAWSANHFEYLNEFKTIYSTKVLNNFEQLLSGSYNSETIKNTGLIATRFLTRSLSTKVLILKSSINKLYRFLKPPGFTIAILGTDGAGKTTIINELKKPLSKSVHKALFYEHMRPNLIPNIAQLFGKPKSNIQTTNPHSSSQSGFFVSLFRLLYYVCDYTFGYWLKIYPILVKKSSIWIFDRYYYDYLIDQKRTRINLPIWIIKALQLLVPKPKLIFCLGAEPSVIHKRKPELPIEEVTRQVHELKEFCENNNRAVWIDTGMSIEASSSEVIKNIILEMKKENI